MSFIVRPVRHEDLNQLTDLARQFTLLNLPGEKKVLAQKIDVSKQSFEGKLSKRESVYTFVVEDVEEQLVVGSSSVMAKHGTPDVPHNYFRLLKKSHYSEDLGIGFIHQILRFQQDEDGPSEIGGLLVDKIYRRRPEKLGKQISLSRFLYVGLYPERFEKRILCELTPPLTDEGRSEFWEALGRRFTGLPYQEADLLSQTHKEFIGSLFPQEDIYLCLLDSKARSVLGRVGEQTKPAQHLLESIGFEYLDEVDPFDGGPHFGADTQNILAIQQGRRVKITEFKDAVYKEQGLIGTAGDEFTAGLVSYDLRDDELAVAPKSRKLLNLENGQEIFLSPWNYPKRGKEQT
jgi:arginine N-succinyltransferase